MSSADIPCPSLSQSAKVRQRKPPKVSFFVPKQQCWTEIPLYYNTTHLINSKIICPYERKRSEVIAPIDFAMFSHPWSSRPLAAPGWPLIPGTEHRDYGDALYAGQSYYLPYCGALSIRIMMMLVICQECYVLHGFGKGAFTYTQL